MWPPVGQPQEHCAEAQVGGKWEERYDWGRGNIVIWEGNTMFSNDYE
jgi:hypothetical protein